MGFQRASGKGRTRRYARLFQGFAAGQGISGKADNAPVCFRGTSIANQLPALFLFDANVPFLFLAFVAYAVGQGHVFKGLFFSYYLAAPNADTYHGVSSPSMRKCPPVRFERRSRSGLFRFLYLDAIIRFPASGVKRFFYGRFPGGGDEGGRVKTAEEASMKKGLIMILSGILLSPDDFCCNGSKFRLCLSLMNVPRRAASKQPRKNRGRQHENG